MTTYFQSNRNGWTYHYHRFLHRPSSLAYCGLVEVSLEGDYFLWSAPGFNKIQWRRINGFAEGIALAEAVVGDATTEEGDFTVYSMLLDWIRENPGAATDYVNRAVDSVVELINHDYCWADPQG